MDAFVKLGKGLRCFSGGERYRKCPLRRRENMARQCQHRHGARTGTGRRSTTNKPKMEMGAIRKGCQDGGRKPVVTGPGKTAKSRKRQDWAHTHIRKDPQVPWLFCHQKVNMPSTTELDMHIAGDKPQFSSSTQIIQTQKACPVKLNSSAPSGGPSHSLLLKN